MPIDFPANPTTGQIFSDGAGNDFMFNGTGWGKGGHFVPIQNNVYDLGSASFRWRTVYTGDLSLRNAIGDWTIVEGAEDLFITNNRTGRRYRFVLEEVPI